MGYDLATEGKNEAVALGEGAPNARVVHVSGRDVAFPNDAVEYEIWDGSAVYPWPAAAAETTVVSVSGNDDLVGTGAQKLEVLGLDDDWVEVVLEAIEMDGTTPVVVATDLLRVNSFRMTQAGSGKTNAGDIDIKHGATVIGRIKAGRSKSANGFYSVPAGHSALIMQEQISSGASFIGTRWTRPDSSGIAYRDRGSNDGVAGFNHVYPYAIGEKLEEKTDYFFIAEGSGGGTIEMNAQAILKLFKVINP